MLPLNLVVDSTETSQEVIQDETESNLGFRVLLLFCDRQKLPKKVVDVLAFGEEVFHLY
jgi:hypothetical protein